LAHMGQGVCIYCLSLPTMSSLTGHQSAVLNRVRAVSFDLDDTFWDCAPAIIKAEETLYQWLEKHYPAITDAHSREDMPIMRAAMYETHPHLATDVTLMRKAFLEELLQPHLNDNHTAEHAFDVFYRARSEVVLYEGTHELLQALKNTHQLAAITNGNADLKQIGLAHYFEDIQRAAIDNPPKPSSHMFDTCCSNLGIAANQLLHVGDNPKTDVFGAQQAGAHTVWFNQLEARWPDELKSADFEVRSLPELQHLLGA